ncbi:MULTISPECIES: YbfB/YjiJ family MFS transporter [unclassified Mesorhizobium]|uniref:YbfB/YjiJ family MFS transporter n=1 Tax=unclassified Mesorhizobium TaxID=325217 RepID=UPI00112C0755|nr:MULTISPECIES: YbfB/YjiJ family MFS transporter [unclassified Mesorhizobium]MBZ9704586.1 YbfB/YjiJ family MFS transporter [Mesorhizobium sp. CO1-1-3]MBZ9916486.1 YbfB/YjiJ family MFS transporter [Mesorhizobium sp. BR1-1-7]MBZ9948926.1 YbfB/YjiJ family MFS transporter [Mesorhizobium sp. BR1-1-11]MBZ9951482.1 YbfB/YjiJ family MFS transporter [Mesorhizobium sp. BR1-1-15]MBZ9968767.1 YbfB/YjiJ family MFS transporter [Mesorhizobium sp. BR1-1-12]
MTSATSTALRFAFAGMIAMAVAMGIGRFVYTPILPGMMEELHLSAADAGWIASANYLGYLAGAFAAAGGWAHGRERLLMLAGLGASALLAALMGLSDTIAAFLVIRFLAGLASAFVMVFLASIVFSHLAAAGRSDLQAWHFGGVGLGIALSSVLMAALVSEHAGWAAGWLWSAAISACGFVVVALLVDSGPLASGDTGREPALPKDRSLTKVIVAYGLFGFGYVVTATFLVAIVRQGGGGRVFEAVVWMVTGLAGFPSVWLWQKISARIGLYATYALGCFVEVVGIVASVAVGGRTGPLLGGLLVGGTFIAITAIGLQTARQLAPQAPRRTFALMTASFGLGQIIGPIAAGLLAQASGDFFLASIAAAAVLVASGVITWSAAPKSP